MPSEWHYAFLGETVKIAIFFALMTSQFIWERIFLLFLVGKENQFKKSEVSFNLRKLKDWKIYKRVSGEWNFFKTVKKYLEAKNVE